MPSKSVRKKRRDHHRTGSNAEFGVLPAATHRVPATVAKNKFAGILDDVMQGRDVTIMKHNSPKAVVISVERYDALTKASSPDLAALSAEFDARLARMQAPAARTALQAAFEASPEELGRAALKPLRSR